MGDKLKITDEAAAHGFADGPDVDFDFKHSPQSRPTLFIQCDLNSGAYLKGDPSGVGNWDAVWGDVVVDTGIACEVEKVLSETDLQYRLPDDTWVEEDGVEARFFIEGELVATIEKETDDE